SASQAILAGDMDVAIACGVENMTRVPMGSDMGGFSNQVINKHNIVPQGFSAEMIASKWELNREELDALSLESHRKAAKAMDDGLFQREILPMELESGLFEQDEGIRKDTSLEKLGDLTPSFQPDDGVVTAGNSSQISDGAAGLLLMSSEKAEELHLKPRARVIARTVVGEDPELMLTGVIPATKKVLAKAGLTIEDMDTIEINEAFASVVKAWEKELQPDMD